MEVECGFLTYHPPMPHFPTIVRYKGQWMPEALITHGDQKRFTDAELAAEFHNQHMEAVKAHDRAYPWGESLELDIADARIGVLERFAMAPHFDQNQST